MVSVTHEQWRAIPGFEGLYEASDVGRIRGVDRVVQQGDGRGGKIDVQVKGCVMALRVGKNGYQCVTLRGEQRKQWSVHTLVAMAWIGPRGQKMEVNHRNGIKTDNRLANLEYVTRGENNRHAFRTGLATRKGEAAALAVRFAPPSSA